MKSSGSHVGAALAGWEYPLSREAIGVDNLIEVYLRSHHDKKQGPFKPLPRPWPDPNVWTSRKPAASQAEVRAALALRGHGSTPSKPSTRQPRDERGRFAKRR